ncbi:nuclear valosin-containing protein-like [Gigantopelta aegis]|uniref:nuclear valosin-containing protein-like n=1 Tax=Gigantopelta aegis TaxID=1735272 RepID=UPI001B88D6EB|nr:nuclear valosin-containing protein-like [Gigantopelta aegis]
MKRKSQEYKLGSMSQHGNYISDPKLVPRIKQYMKVNRGKKHFNISDIAEDLQKQYGEYARKKRSTFFKSVEKAYQLVCQQLNANDPDLLSKEEAKHLSKKTKTADTSSDDSDSDNKSFSSENPDYEVYEETNSMNNMMFDLYKSSPTVSKTSQSVESEKKGQLKTIKDSRLNEQMDTSVNSTTAETIIDLTEANGTSGVPKTPVVKKPSSDVSQSGRKKNKKQKGEEEKQTEKNEKQKGPVIQSSTFTFDDIGGNEATLKEVCKLLVHMKHPEVYQKLGITPPRGILLHGPPGCGKTLLAHAIAGELCLPFIKLASTEIVSGVSGESEEKIRDLFDKAVTTAPCIVFIDEIDAITPKRETASKDMERRIVAQLLSCMDDLNMKNSANVLVIGATNRPDSLDPALRRAGRFDREISMGIPDESARQRILQVLCKSLRLCEGFDFHQLARNTPGFVGADLMALAREAAMIAVNRVFDTIQSELVKMKDENTDASVDVCVDSVKSKEECISQNSRSSELLTVLDWLKEQPPLTDKQLEDLYITGEDFQQAISYVQPSAKREGFATIPDVTWKDVGALKSVREELQLAILAPVQHPAEFKALGLTSPPGILLAGPPGCGKTLLAKAVANESGINFISVKGPELLNMYVGESERAVRQVFQRARNSSPCVIFFDELDALCPKRSGSGEGGSSVRVVNQMLTEMDGLESRKQVFIMAATNRPDIIDPAILRPGRLDKMLYVGLPSQTDRHDILVTITKNGTKPSLSADVNLEEISKDSRCDRLTGADLAALVREASVTALKDIISQPDRVQVHISVAKVHFEAAFQKVRPSVSKKDEEKYERLKTRLQPDTNIV